MRCSKRNHKHFLHFHGSAVPSRKLETNYSRIKYNEIFIWKDVFLRIFISNSNFTFDTLAQTHRRQCYVRAEHLFVSLRWEMTSGRAIKAFQRPNEPRMTSIASVFRRRKLRWAAFSIPLWADRAKARFSLFMI